MALRLTAVEILWKIRGLAVHVPSRHNYFLTASEQTARFALAWCSFAPAFACAFASRH
jgi:hypothetical protein